MCWYTSVYFITCVAAYTRHAPAAVDLALLRAPVSVRGLRVVAQVRRHARRPRARACYQPITD
eukprot:8909132-Pyramimonas_sp.AAC.1